MIEILATISKEPPPVDDIAGLLSFFFMVIVLLGIAALIKSVVQGPAANPTPPNFQPVQPDPGALVHQTGNQPVTRVRPLDVDLVIDVVNVKLDDTSRHVPYQGRN